MRRAIVAVAIVCLSPIIVANGAPQASAPPPSQARASDTQLPPISVVDLKQLDAALAGLRGKAVLVNFWAIWCEPCVAELPDFLATGRAFATQNTAVLTVSYDLMIPDVTREDVLRKMRSFVAERKIDAPVLIYDAPDYDAINARFGLPGPVPVTIAIDASGKVVDRHAGQTTREQFEALMRRALAK